MLEYLRPDNLEDALLTLTEQPCTLLAGGTDFYPARVGKKWWFMTKVAPPMTCLEMLLRKLDYHPVPATLKT
jgi:hypothetical protein